MKTERDPNDANNHANRGGAYLQVGKADLDKANSLARDGLKALGAEP